MLRGVGNLIESKVRAQDVACRLGGDEFIVVMPDATLETARFKAGELLGKLTRLHLEMPVPLVEFSMGVAAYPEHGISGADLLKSADTALYRAKGQGGGRVVAAA